MEKKRRKTIEWSNQAVALMSIGMPRKEISELLGISETNIRKYTSNNWAEYIYIDGYRKRGERRTVEDARKALESDPALGEKIMGDRKFEISKSFDNGQIKNGAVVKCSHRNDPVYIEHGCMKTDTFWTHKSIHPVHAANYFRNRGWALGASPNSDVCPKCMEFIVKNRREKTVKDMASVNLNPAPVILAKAKANLKEAFIAAMPSAVEPVKSIKEMDKATKRIIDDKLDEVYNLRKGGYQLDWSDAKVASDLGTHERNVAIVREEFHGPNTRAEDKDKILKDLKANAEEIIREQKRIEELLKRIEELDLKVNDAVSTNDKRYEKFFEAYRKISY